MKIVEWIDLYISAPSREASILLLLWHPVLPAGEGSSTRNLMTQTDSGYKLIQCDTTQGQANYLYFKNK